MFMIADWGLRESGFHEHCETCIKISRCTVLPIDGKSCPIVSCDFNCTLRFHACKKLEHEELCPSKQIPCLNAEYGCPERMQRRNVSKHLRSCAASVVHCPVEWVRSRISKHTKFMQAEPNNSTLDLSLLLSDQRQYRKHLQEVESGVFSADHQYVWFDVSKYAYPYANVQRNEACTYDDNDKQMDYGCGRLGPNWSTTYAAQDLKTLSDDPSRLLLDINISCCKEIKYYDPTQSYSCSQVFRRDEFEWHCKNIHQDVMGSIGGWLEERCPLVEYGCQFSLRRLHPMPEGSTVTHNPEIECFAFKPPSHFADEYQTSNRINCTVDTQHTTDYPKRRITFTELPYEIFRHIGSYLDGYSLNNLSQTCLLMSDVCSSLLKEKGLVLILWKKDKLCGQVTWKPSTHWCFSTSFSPIKRWHFGKKKHMSDHLQRCPYFDRNTHTHGAPQIMEFLPQVGEKLPSESILHAALKKPSRINEDNECCIQT